MDSTAATSRRLLAGSLRLPPGARRARRPRVEPGVWLTTIVLLLSAALGGAVIALGGAYGAALVGALLLLAAAMAVPLRLLFMATIAMAFIVIGQLQYFARIDKAHWIAYLMAMVLFLRTLAQAQSTGQAAQREGGLHLPLPILLYGAFLLVAIGASLIHRVPPLQWLVSGKAYFVLPVIVLVFAVGGVRMADVQSFVRWMPWLLAAQVPVALYQRFVVAARRVGDSPWDAVVGLFGGDPMGGGASGTMGLFSLVAIIFLVEGWRAGRVGRLGLWVGCVSALAAVALAEVKVVIVLLPLAGLMMSAGAMRKNPVAALAGLTAVCALSVGLLVLYQSQFTSVRGAEGKSVAAYVEQVIERNASSRVQSFGGGDMGRVAALQFWAREQRHASLPDVLLGHGVGSTMASSQAVGQLVQHYKIQIGRSTAAVMLWETGVLGLALLVAALAAGAVSAWRRSRRPDHPEGWIYRGAAVSLVMVVLLLAHGADYVQVPQLQILVFMLLGTLWLPAEERASEGRRWTAHA